MKRSEHIDQIGQALIAARTGMRPLRKNAKGAYAEYADLPEVLDVITEPLQMAGLAIVQSPSMDADTGYCTLTTLLVHADSGQWLESELAMKPELDKGHQGACQAVGSCVSYARRYALAALFSLAQADNDAEGATDAGKLPPRAAKKARPKPAEAPVPATSGGEWTKVSDIAPPAAVTNKAEASAENHIKILSVISNDSGKGPSYRVQTSLESAIDVKTRELYDLPAIWEDEIATEANYALSNDMPVGLVMETKPGTKKGKTFKTLRAIQVKGRPAVPPSDKNGRPFDEDMVWSQDELKLSVDDIPF